MRNPLAGHPPWRQLIIVAVVLPLMIVLAVLAFAWPSARIAPRDLPVGLVGTTPASARAVAGLARSQPGAFDFRRYPDQASARSAIEDRTIYGAFDITAGRVIALEASAGSPAVAQLLTATGRQLAGHASARAAAAGQAKPSVRLTSVDVVATAAGDPRGLVLSSALLPLTICSIIMAAVIVLLLGFRPAWRQLIALIVVCAAAGLGTELIVQGFLGALPHEDAATWASLSLTMLAICATTAGLIDLMGAAGLGVAAVVMVFIGNPFSGGTSAPQLLPSAVDHIGQWLPPGAGASLLRSAAYFNGHAAAGHLSVLIFWTALGLAAVFVGHHAPFNFAASLARSRAQAEVQHA